MSLIHQAIDLFLHLDKHLNSFATAHQVGVYVLLVVIVFCETGWWSGHFCRGIRCCSRWGRWRPPRVSDQSAADYCAALPGGELRGCSQLYNWAGYRAEVFSTESSWLLNKRHLEEAHRFYEKHGRKTIILARFVPIIRTFAPFVAGIGQMPFARFIGFSVSGGIFWVVSVTVAGYYFNQIEFVRTHFQLVVLAIVFISLIPAVLHALQARGKGARGRGAEAATSVDVMGGR